MTSSCTSFAQSVRGEGDREVPSLPSREGRIAYFGLLSELKPAKYIIGIRAEGAEGVLPSSAKKGDYYLQDSRPEEVPKLIAELTAKRAPDPRGQGNGEPPRGPVHLIPQPHPRDRSRHEGGGSKPLERIDQ